VRAVRETGLAAGDRAADVGCGTGQHAAAWVPLGITALAVDPSPGMLRAARRHPGVLPVGARAEALPLRDSSLGLAYFHLSLQHTSWRRAIAEAARVVRPGGGLWIWTLGPDHHPASFLARWFPSVAAIDLRRFPDPVAVAAAARAGGFGDVAMEREADEMVRRAGDWEAAVRAGFVSTLQLVDPEEIEAGLAEFRSAHPDPGAAVRYELRYTVIRALGRSLP